MSKIYHIGAFAKRVNVSQSTLRRWDATGEFKAKRRPSGHRYYEEEDVRRLLSFTPEEMSELQRSHMESMIEEILAIVHKYKQILEGCK